MNAMRGRRVPLLSFAFTSSVAWTHYIHAFVRFFVSAQVKTWGPTRADPTNLWMLMRLVGANLEDQSLARTCRGEQLLLISETHNRYGMK